MPYRRAKSSGPHNESKQAFPLLFDGADATLAADVAEAIAAPGTTLAAAGAEKPAALASAACCAARCLTLSRFNLDGFARPKC